MTNGTNNNLPKDSKGHINQNLLIAIIGAIATIAAAILPWALDRAAQPEQAPTAIQSPSTAVATPFEATATNTVVVVPTSTPETPTVTAAPSNEETGVYNAYLAFDFDGKFFETNFNTDQRIYLFFDLNDPTQRNIVRVIVSAVDVPGVLVDTQRYNIINEYPNPKVKLVISEGGLSSGKYKVVVYLNGSLDETLEFTVTK